MGGVCNHKGANLRRFKKKSYYEWDLKQQKSLKYNGSVQLNSGKRAFVLRGDFQEIALKNYHLVPHKAESNIAQSSMLW